MTFIPNWEEFEKSAEMLYLRDPINTRYSIKYSHSKGVFIAKITDNKKVPTHQRLHKAMKLIRLCKCFYMSPQSQKTISSPDEDAVLQSQSTVQELHSPHQLESHSTIDQAQQPTSPAPTPSPSRPTRKRRHPNEDILEKAYEVMHAAKNRMISRDEFDVYGQYVGTKLRALNDEHSAIMAKYYINNILLDARLGKYRTSSNNNQRQPIVQQGYSTASSDISPEPSEEHIIQNILAIMDSSSTNSINDANIN